MRRLLTATFLVSAAAIAYEILLMRVLSIVQWHHFAYMIISLALLGYGVSGTFIALARSWLQPRFETAFSVSALCFCFAMVACFAIGQRIPFNALEVVWDPWQFAYLAILYLLFFVPFFFAATCIGLAFTCCSDSIHRIYFFDLLGAGSGALLIIALLFIAPPAASLIMLTVIALLASFIAATSAPARRGLFAVQTATLLIALFATTSGLLELRISEYKGLRQALEVVDSRVSTESSSPLGLLTVVESPRIPFRHAPGLSPNAGFVPPQQVAVFTDGDGMSAITRFDGDTAAMGYLGEMTSALPYALLDAPTVLVLGAGGGADVLAALYHGATSVDAVELNSQMAKLLTETYADFSGDLYGNDQVTLHIGEARSHVASSEEQYDLIQVSLLDSFAASGAGAHALSESYLYTVEAIRDYLKRTTEGGVLAITRWLKLPPRDSLKLAATAIRALQESGVAEPGARLALIRSWNTSTLLIKNGDFSAPEIEQIKAFSRARSFDTAYYPGMQNAEANRYNQLDAPYLYEGIRALLGDNAESYLARYKFRIAPATDDRPYFFHFFRWQTLPEIMSLRKRGGAGLIEWGYLILVATTVQAALAGILLILLPLAIVSGRRRSESDMGMGCYFFLLGLAFLFVEIAFIQKFILFLGHPLYAVAVVLASFLLFAGLGSISSARFVSRVTAMGKQPVAIAVLGIAVFAISYALLLPIIRDHLIGLPDGMRILLCVLMVGPLAFLMGMPFPIGLRLVANRAPGFVPWAWGINGFASVISASLATLIAMAAGFSVVIMLALACYAVAALIAPDAPAEG